LIKERQGESAMSLRSGAPLRAPLSMETWEVMREAIPRGEAERIARLMGYSVDYVRRWCREPEGSDEEPAGRRDPLLMITTFLDALYARNPAGADLVVDYINSEAAILRQIHERETKPAKQTERDLREAARRMIEAADAIAGTKQ